jgi:hypothetical protein
MRFSLWVEIPEIVTKKLPFYAENPVLLSRGFRPGAVIEASVTVEDLRRVVAARETKQGRMLYGREQLHDLPRTNILTTYTALAAVINNAANISSY